MHKKIVSLVCFSPSESEVYMKHLDLTEEDVIIQDEHPAYIEVENVIYPFSLFSRIIACDEASHQTVLELKEQAT